MPQPCHKRCHTCHKTCHKAHHKACHTCHKQTDGGRGPSLIGLYNRGTERLTSGQDVQVDDNYVRTSILNPHSQIVEGYTPIMPIFEGQINEETLLQLIAYIKSLSEESE